MYKCALLASKVSKASAGWLAGWPLWSQRGRCFDESVTPQYIFSLLCHKCLEKLRKKTQKFGNCVPWRNCRSRSSLSFKRKHFSVICLEPVQKIKCFVSCYYLSTNNMKKKNPWHTILIIFQGRLSFFTKFHITQKIILKNM